MLANRLRRSPKRRRARALRVVAVFGLLGFAAVVPQAAAADPDFVTVDPMSQISTDDDASIYITVKTEDAPATITLTENGAETRSFEESGGVSHAYLVSIPAIKCSPSNTLKVDVVYANNTHPSVSQTTTGIVVLCPHFASSPARVVGTDPVTLKLTRWDEDGGYDSLGAYTGDDKAKKLFLDGALIGTFGYRVAPAATVNPTCGTHTVKLVQQTDYGTLEVSDTLEAWCSTWQVSPKGLISPTGVTTSHPFTISDPTTDYRANTTIDASLEPADGGTVTPLGTVTFPAGGKLSHTFSDNGTFACSGSEAYTIHVHINQPDPPPPPPSGPILRFAPRLAPIVTDEDIPFHVLCPHLNRSNYDDYVIDQSALPYDLPVETYGFDDDTNAYDARDVQPKTFRVDDTVIGSTLGNDFHGTVNPSCGEHTYSVTQPTGLGPVALDFEFTVLCPQVTLDPPVIASDAQPQVIEVDGTSFHSPWPTEGGLAPQPYVLSVDGKQIDNGETDVDGAVQNVFTTADLGCGVHDVTITELDPFGGEDGANLTAPNAAPAAAPTDPQAPLSASAPLTVTCPTTPPPPPPPPGRPGTPNGHPGTPPKPTLAVNPHGVIAGMRTFVTGTGFTPGHTVTLTWKLPGGRSEPACPGRTVTVLGNGTLATPCQIPHHDRIGSRVLVGNDGSRSASTTALIISSTMQPSRRHDRFVVRG